MRATLITPSFRGDLAMARLLCASVDRHVDEDINHVLAVPRRDLSLFADLASPRRSVVDQRSVLPRGFFNLPLPQQVSVGPRFTKRLRSHWVTPYGPVRGWILQQIVKLSADALSDHDVLIFADSDNVFVRRFSMDDVLIDGQVRLYSKPGAGYRFPTHRRWHAEAARLLGLPATDYFGSDYIGSGVVWRRDVLIALQQRLEQIHGTCWQRVIARCSSVSEYVLYGVFAEHVLGGDSRQLPSAEEWALGWSFDHGQPDADQRFVDALQPHHRMAAIQSTETLDPERRERLLRRVAGLD